MLVFNVGTLYLDVDCRPKGAQREMEQEKEKEKERERVIVAFERYE